MLKRRIPNKGLIRDFAGRNGLAQAYRQVFQQLCGELHEPGRRACAIASAGHEEGRSSLAINLAEIAARETDGAVLLIDGDTENATLHQPFGAQASPGLSDVISGDVEPKSAIQSVGENGLRLLSCGSSPVSAVTLSESERVGTLLDEIRKQFAWVFIDTAPLLTEPGMAGFASRADGVLLAVRWAGTRSQLVTAAVDKLDAADARSVGVVLTQRSFVIPSYIYRRL